MCVCVLEISLTAIIMKLSSAFYRLPRKLFPQSYRIPIGILDWSPHLCVAHPLRIECLRSTDPDKAWKPWGRVFERQAAWPWWGAGGESVSSHVVLVICCGVLLLSPWGPPSAVLVHLTRSSALEGSGKGVSPPTLQHVCFYMVGFLSRTVALPVFLERGDSWYLLSR